MFYGYCCTENQRMEPVAIKDVPTIWSYFQIHKNVYPRVFFTESNNDIIVAESLNGRIVFPPHLALVDLKHDLVKFEEQPNAFSGKWFNEVLQQLGFTNQAEAPRTLEEADRIIQHLYSQLEQDSN
jgi:hypothetical protein